MMRSIALVVGIDAADVREALGEELTDTQVDLFLRDAARSGVLYDDLRACVHAYLAGKDWYKGIEELRALNPFAGVDVDAFMREVRGDGEETEYDETLDGGYCPQHGAFFGNDTSCPQCDHEAWKNTEVDHE